MHSGNIRYQFVCANRLQDVQILHDGQRSRGGQTSQVAALDTGARRVGRNDLLELEIGGRRLVGSARRRQGRRRLHRNVFDERALDVSADGGGIRVEIMNSPVTE